MNPPPPAATAPLRLGRIALIVCVLIVLGLALGWVPRWLARQRLLAESRIDAIPTVETVFPAAARPDLTAPLPAEVQPFVEATLHARASGYLKSWSADIGDLVTNGQVLAEIDTPELDAQLAQARAELAQAQAACDLAKLTADRWTELLKSASVSEQETAEKHSDYVLKQANVAASRANVQRLEEMKQFDRVTAPFDGVVTVRKTDIGQLITAGSGSELFRLAQVNPLRIYVRVPQGLMHAIAVGQKAALTFQDLPSREFLATVTRTAGAVDPASRTLLVELQVPNPKGEILAGSYAQVSFRESAAAPVFTLSDKAFLFRAQGMQAAIVGPDNKVHLSPLKLGRDFGNTVEVLAGLTATDRVVINPPDGIAEGATVRLAVPVAATNSIP